MRRRKKRISPFKIVLIVLVLIIGANIGARYIISESNYEHNLGASFYVATNNYAINDTFVNFKYATNSNVEDNYSIIRSTFNAIRYLNKNTAYAEEPNLPDMIKHFDLYAQMLFGHFTSNPLAVSGYINKLEGLRATIHFDKENFAQKINDSPASILFNGNFKTHEFVAVRPNTTSATRMYIIRSNGNVNTNDTIEDYGSNLVALITIDLE